MRRALTTVGALVLGLVVGLAGVAVHPTWWGLVLAVAATLTAAAALPGGRVRLAFALGWVALVVWVMFPRDEGDYVTSADLHGYALLGLGAALLMATVVTLPRRSGSDLPRGSDRTG